MAITIPAGATALVQTTDTAMAQPLAGGRGSSDKLLADVVSELKKVNVLLEAIQSKASFIEARSDTYSAHSHDWRRHREQMKEDIQKSKTYEEKKASLMLYRQWTKETFWMIWQLREPASAQVSPLSASKGCGRLEPQLAHYGSEVSRVELRAKAVHIDIDRKKASNVQLQFVDCCVLQQLREPASWPFRATVSSEGASAAFRYAQRCQASEKTKAVGPRFGAMYVTKHC